MIKYKNIKKTVTEKVFDSVVCDKCGKILNDDDVMEFQEVYSIRFTGGYASVFGDMNEIECDLCQQCLYELIKDYCRTVDGFRFNQKF